MTEERRWRRLGVAESDSVEFGLWSGRKCRPCIVSIVTVTKDHRYDVARPDTKARRPRPYFELFSPG